MADFFKDLMAFIALSAFSGTALIWLDLIRTVA